MSFWTTLKSWILHFVMFLRGHKIGHLWLFRYPKWVPGGLGLKSIPAIPIYHSDVKKAIAMLVKRKKGVGLAKEGLKQNKFTIDGCTASAHDFLFHEDLFNEAMENIEKLHTYTPLEMLKTTLKGIEHSGKLEVKKNLALEDPKQWAMAWTTHDQHYLSAQSKLNEWALSLTDVQQANSQFWPMIAENGLSFNLLFLEKIQEKNAARFRSPFGNNWPDTLENAYNSGNLYGIDLSIFDHIAPHKVKKTIRFTPSTTIYLIMEPTTKKLSPTLIRVSCHSGPSTFYTPTDKAWLYALQAAKTSITLYGIWLGHVYQWHIVTAAMQMTMYNTFSKEHSIYQLLAPQSNYGIGFDDILLIFWWKIGPPTAISSPKQFLTLLNHFAAERNFFDDNPKTTLKNFGLKEEIFTVATPWDQYPLVKSALEIWEATEDYITIFVKESYKDDSDIVNDLALQTWIKRSSKKNQGNIRGLPAMNNQSALIQVLTSIVYRIVIHGVSYLNRSLNPSKTFVANFPPCLQKTEIPNPDTEISTKELLKYMPYTDTIGKMVNFYYIFIFGEPIESLITDELFFEGGPHEPRNAALIAYRERISTFIENYDPKSAKSQWPLNIDT